jgi:hypothetical protein
MLEYGPIPDYNFTYDEAFLYCLTLDHNGHKDWRMPTVDEYNNKIAVYYWYEDRRVTDIFFRKVNPVRDTDD